MENIFHETIEPYVRSK